MNVSRRNFLFGTAAAISTAALSTHSHKKVYANPIPEEDPICPLGKEFKFTKSLSDNFYGNAINPNKWWDFNPSWNC